jgi:hypothetical protein
VSSFTRSKKEGASLVSIEAQWPGTCQRCTKGWGKGDKLDRPKSGGPWMHTRCARQTPAAERPVPANLDGVTVTTEQRQKIASGKTLHKDLAERALETWKVDGWKLTEEQAEGLMGS